jgi:hypothetical protein
MSDEGTLDCGVGGGDAAGVGSWPLPLPAAEVSCVGVVLSPVETDLPFFFAMADESNYMSSRGAWLETKLSKLLRIENRRGLVVIMWGVVRFDVISKTKGENESEGYIYLN